MRTQYEDKLLLTLPSLVKEIQAENRRQIEKWKVQTHAMADWLAILGEEVGEMNQAYLQARFGNGDLTHLHEEAIQTATIVLKIAEMTASRKEGGNG